MIELLYLAVIISCLGLMIFITGKGLKSKMNLAFLMFLVGVLSFVGTFYVYLFIDLGENLLLWGKLNYAASIFGFSALAYFFYHFPNEKWKMPRWMGGVAIIETVFLMTITILTPLIDGGEIMTNEGPRVVLGRWYLWYVVHALVFTGLALGIGVWKIIALKGMEKTKQKIAFWGFVVAAGMIVLTNVILPKYGMQSHLKYTIVWFIPFVFAPFYAIQKYRFLDIKMEISRNFKRIVALGLALIIGIWLHESIKEDGMMVIISAILGAILIYEGVWWLFKSRVWHRFLGVNDVEQMKMVLSDFKGRHVFYGSEKRLEGDLRRTFEKNLRIRLVKIVMIREEKKFEELKKYFEGNEEKFLVKKEVIAREEQEKVKLPFSEELRELGEAVWPIWKREGELIGFFVTGKKMFDDPFHEEELVLIQDFVHHVALLLTGALFHEELQKEIRQKTKKLRMKNEKVKELLGQQADFIAVSAHELRTPLNIAMLHLERLGSQVKSDSEMKKYLETVDGAIERLHGLVQRLFDVQQFDLNKVRLNMEKVGVREYFERMGKSLGPVMGKKGLDFGMEIRVGRKEKWEIDEGQMAQVFQNLFSNVIKFVPKGKKVRLRVKEENGEILASLADGGEGVTDEMKKSVFQKFKGKHAVSGKGIGLGLYISKKIIQLHGGKIWVEDADLGGAEFVVRMPKVE